MITILPECTLSVFTDIVFLAGSAGNQLYRIWDYIPAAIIKYKKVIRSHHVVQYNQAVTLLRLPEPLEISVTIFGEF